MWGEMKIMNNISVKLDDGNFVYRVGAIILNNNQLLMVRNDKSSHYYSVGGRVRIGESSIEALKREIIEEIGHELKIGNLAVIQESFYVCAKEKFHEICFFYKVNYDENKPLRSGGFTEESGAEYFEWFDIDKLDEYEIYPEFFKTKLLNEYGIKHFVNKCY